MSIEWTLVEKTFVGITIVCSQEPELILLLNNANSVPIRSVLFKRK